MAHPSESIQVKGTFQVKDTHLDRATRLGSLVSFSFCCLGKEYAAPTVDVFSYLLLNLLDVIFSVEINLDTLENPPVLLTMIIHC